MLDSDTKEEKSRNCSPPKTDMGYQEMKLTLSHREVLRVVKTTFGVFGELFLYAFGAQFRMWAL